MKKLILIALVFVGFGVTVDAQEISKHAIGLRLGDSDGFGAEVSYQLGLGSNNRLEADLGWRSGRGVNGFKLTGLYQWVWHLDGNFNWYAGAGGGLASYSFDKIDANDTAVFATGNVGVEYHFDIPLLLSLDVRPEIGFGDFRNDLEFDIALGIRYKFN